MSIRISTGPLVGSILSHRRWPGLPILAAVLALAGGLATSAGASAAEAVPHLNVEPSCRAITAQNAPQNHGDLHALSHGLRQDVASCRNEEAQARSKLDQVWRTFSARQRGHCVRLMSYGGLPSYVELLTCLEMGKQAAATPASPGHKTQKTLPADG